MGKITKQELHSSVNEELDKIGVLTQDINGLSQDLITNYASKSHASEHLPNGNDPLDLDALGIYQLTNGANVKDITGINGSTAMNIDEVFNTGFYYANNFWGAGGTLPVNNNSYVIQVFNTSSACIQIAFGINANSGTKQYKRVRIGATWGTWEEIGSIPNFEPLIDSITIYVDGTLGTDSNGYGKTSANGAYKTLTYAFNQLPWFRGGKVIIEIANGTYGYSNAGRYYHSHPYEIIVNGQSADGVILTGIGLPKAKKVSVQNMTINGQIAFDDGNVLFSNIKNNGGIVMNNSIVTVANSNISNVTSNNAIGAYSNSIVFLDTVTGTNNSCGIYSDGSVVRKKNTTITGTTPQATVNGGQIL